MTYSSFPVELKEGATERQKQYIDAVNEGGSYVAGAALLGISEAVVRTALNKLRAAAALNGNAPGLAGMNNLLSSVETLKGRSIYYDPVAGRADKVWVKTDVTAELRMEMMRAAAAAMADEIPRAKPVRAPAATDARLLTAYTITDAHVGMVAWPAETGEAWDLKIAERVLTGCFEKMVAAAPRSRYALIGQLGDFLHSDGMKSVTPEHGHLLDSDGRFPRVVGVAIRIIRRLVAAALEKHEVVYLLLGEGNHDPASSIWLRALFAALYENEPRVVVNTSSYPYYAHQHGETMIAYHHGHLTDPSSVDRLFAAAFSKLWGATTKRYCHMGHKHHVHEKEFSGMTVFQHATLAAKDAYAARGGWFAKRAANAVIYHDKYGEVGRITVCPEMVEDGLLEAA